MTNFAFGKTGLQLRFNFFEKSENFKSADHCKLLINLAYNNPKDNFYIIGQNNLNKIDIELKKKLFPHNNVYNTLENANKDLDKLYESPLIWLNKNQVNLDYAIIGGGPTLNVNIPNKIHIKSGTLGKPLDSAKRGVAPIIHTLNETNIDWVSLADDPRCLNTCVAKDLFNKPKKILSQINTEILSESIKSYENQELIKTKIDVSYSNIEMACNLDENIYFLDDSWKERKTSVGMVLNEAGVDERLNTKKLSNGHRPRYPILKKWLLDNFDNTCIYGKWHEDIMKSNIAFKGFIDRPTLYPEMKKWKHSFCIPIDKGWATAKYLEYLKCGISPFMHPEYDDQKNTNIQNFYRVQSVEEIKDKIDMNDNIHIEEINKGIKNCLSDEYISGQKINDEIYESLGLKRNIKNKLRDLWTPQAVGSLDGFMD